MAIISSNSFPLIRIILIQGPGQQWARIGPDNDMMAPNNMYTIIYYDSLSIHI